MHFFSTNEKPPLYAGIAVVSFMILIGLTIAGTAVAFTVLIPVFVVLSPILLPMVIITSSFLATGFLVSGSLWASVIALLVWLYKEEEHSRYTLNARVRPERAIKLAGGGKLPGGDKPSPEGHKPSPEDNKPLEVDNLPRKAKSAEGDKLTGDDKPLGGFKPSIHVMSKVLLVEQNPNGPKCYGPRTPTKRSHQNHFSMDSTKLRSNFMKEYHKVPRVGAFAYKYFTSRDKKYINHIYE